MTDDTTPVSDAFAALGDETRVAILEAFVDARREDPPRYAVRVTLDDEAFRATVDGDGDVVATERMTA